MRLRESIDDGAGDIGNAFGEEVSASPGELREAVPEDANELTGYGHDDDLSIDAVRVETPLDRFL